MKERPRRNRRTAAIRDLVRENHIAVRDLILPVFLIDGQQKKVPIPAMPDFYRYTPDLLLELCDELMRLGIRAIAPFPAIEDRLKDRTGSEALREDGLYLRTIRLLKENYPELLIFSDVALDPYSSDGHDGLVSPAGEILNDETLPLLASMAVAQARAGADYVSPSDMMDGRVGYIRDALDAAGFSATGILSYTAKYASGFYGPFREALDSAPRSGDKKTYQMDPANAIEALRELELDLREGADMVMVKPGLPYLDVLRRLRDAATVPVAVYNVSGEYSMLKAAADRGWLNYETAVREVLLSFKRAGADVILTYHALEFARWEAGNPDH
ncbi:MAG: porphobilinogen synthase [Spirochaetales bacterium]|nr:porphobilinogen synthase [Spirochaetales bacterium]